MLSKVDSEQRRPGHVPADFATLRGDASDGLPGVAGIGEKTTSALLAAPTHPDQIKELAERCGLTGPVSSLTKAPAKS